MIKKVTIVLIGLIALSNMVFGQDQTAELLGRDKSGIAFEPFCKLQQPLAPMGIVRKHQQLGAPIPRVFGFFCGCQKICPDALEMVRASAVGPACRAAGAL